MAKRIIRLTESDLHKIIKESVKRALNEAPRARDIMNTYHKGPWNDWRDEYDELWDRDNNDRATHQDLEKKYYDAVYRDFGGLTPEYYKALKRHEAYRDSHHPWLSPSGRQKRDEIDAAYNEKYGFDPEDDDYSRLSRFLPGGGEGSSKKPKKDRAKRGTNYGRVKADASYGQPQQQEPIEGPEELSQGSGMSLEDIEAKMRAMGYIK
jgi:hypothetical protein